MLIAILSILIVIIAIFTEIGRKTALYICIFIGKILKYIFNELEVHSAKKLLETCKNAKIRFNGRDFEYFTNGKFDSHIKINEYEYKYNIFEDELYICYFKK